MPGALPRGTQVCGSHTHALPRERICERHERDARRQTTALCSRTSTARMPFVPVALRRNQHTIKIIRQQIPKKDPKVLKKDVCSSNPESFPLRFLLKWSGPGKRYDWGLGVRSALIYSTRKNWAGRAPQYKRKGLPLLTLHEIWMLRCSSWCLRHGYTRRPAK